MSPEAPERSATTGAHRRTPQQIFVNRAIFTGVIVVVIAAVAVIIGQFLEDDNLDTATVSTRDSWNTAVVVTDDDVRLVDPSSGEVLQSYGVGSRLLDATIETYSKTLVLLALNGQLTQVDLSDGETETAGTVPDGLLEVAGGNRAIMAVGAPTGGDVTVVDTRDLRTLAIGEAAALPDPRMFPQDLLTNPAGTHVAISDANSFQSVLVELATGSTSLLGGQVGAINDTSVVTVQRAGGQAELDVFELSGERVGTVDVPSPVAVMLTGDKSMVTVAADGTITSVSSSGSIDEKGNVAGEDATTEIRGGSTALGGDRLLLLGADSVYAVDEDGDVVLTAQGQLSNDLGSATRCVIVGDGTSTGRSSQYDLDSGELLGALNGGLVTATSYDGCVATVIGGADIQIFDRGEATPVQLEAGSLSGVAPDGAVVVASDVSAGETLIEVSDVDNAVAVSSEPSVVRFADVP
jgi:hypothetical protein